MKVANDRIVVTLRGGLGNQMFQYAFAWALARRTGRSVVLNSWHYRQAHARPLELGNLNIELPISAERWPVGMAHGRLRRLLLRFPDVSGALLGICLESDAALYREPYLSASRRFYHGFWQSHRYFDDYRDELRDQFEFKQPVDSGAKLRRVRPAWTDFLAVHVRRGDYLNPVVRERHGIPPLAYYAESRARLRKSLGQKNTVVFTDDPGWLREESGLLDANSVLASDFLDGPQAEFSLMREACGIVTSNSTFSWWAAYLGDPEITIVPRYWFHRVPTQSLDIAPGHWLVADA